MFRRTRPLTDPVTIHLDDSPLPAERGEPLAAALLASDKVILARSPKLHRPRGPSCMRGGCDGCLARVNGEPNVMTCLHPVAGGERIESQNFIGSRKADFLRITDWFFPQGIDHHHLLVGVPGVSDVVQSFARKLAGLGKLPSEAEAPHAARRLDVDAIVVGGGWAGTVVASRLARAGRSVCLVDDALDHGPLSAGGSLTSAPGRAAELRARYPLDGVTVVAPATAAGVYLGEVLVASGEGAIVVRARAKVFATGAHDGVLAVPNNDLPGIFSARALCRLHAGGVAPDGPIAIVGEGFWADELAGLLGDTVKVRIAADQLVNVKGTGQVRGVVVREGSRERTIKVTAVASATPGAPAFELAAQAGATARCNPAMGYVIDADERGRAGEGLWAVGECRGSAMVPAAIEAEAERVAADVLAELDGHPRP